MLSQLRKYCTKALEKIFEEEEHETRTNRIEAARISATRLQAMDRIRDKKVIVQHEGDTIQTTKLPVKPIEEVYEDIDDLIERLTEDTIEEEVISSSAE